LAEAAGSLDLRRFLPFAGRPTFIFSCGFGGKESIRSRTRKVAGSSSGFLLLMFRPYYIVRRYLNSVFITQLPEHRPYVGIRSSLLPVQDGLGFSLSRPQPFPDLNMESIIVRLDDTDFHSRKVKLGITIIVVRHRFALCLCCQSNLSDLLDWPDKIGDFKLRRKEHHFLADTLFSRGVTDAVPSRPRSFWPVLLPWD
jgi:hypothetical protein